MKTAKKIFAIIALAYFLVNMVACSAPSEQPVITKPIESASQTAEIYNIKLFINGIEVDSATWVNYSGQYDLISK